MLNTALVDLYKDKIDYEQVLEAVLLDMHRNGPVNIHNFEILAHIKLKNPDLFSLYENKIMYLMGLFYKTTEPSSLLEAVYYVFIDTFNEKMGHFYTPTQASINSNIQQNRYYSFSAPTSAGKSHLFRELIKEIEGDIVIVLPSRALIAEYMSKILSIFEDDTSVLVLQFIEDVNRKYARRRIYVITPERGVELFKHLKNLDIKLFLFDEAQISEAGLRGVRFDSFVRRVEKLLPNAKKVFAHPFIENPEAQLLKHNFSASANHSQFLQVSVGKIFIAHSNKSISFFSPYNREFNVNFDEHHLKKVISEGGSLYVYTSKNKIVNQTFMSDFAEYIGLCPEITDKFALGLIDVLKSYIGATDGSKVSNLVRLMKKGIVLHHGSMPLRARLLVENFINNGFARICFATSTLLQGINMPFDIVWIDNFRFEGSEDERSLTMQNLIGRAGRTSQRKNYFDYGFVVVEQKNIETFCDRFLLKPRISDQSLLDSDFTTIDTDYVDIANAIKDDSFNDDLQLTNDQVERLENQNVFNHILYILDHILVNDKPITGSQYYNLGETERKRIKESFKFVYSSHLRRQTLSRAEQSVLSASIPILLWRIQGKSFKEIVSLRHGFLSRGAEVRVIMRQVREQLLSEMDARNTIDKMTIKRSPTASILPNSNLTGGILFPQNTKVTELDYDTLVYDTYDYLDKVIELSLADPLCAALSKYMEKSNDRRALVLSNYIKYGTNDNTEIWLLKYGFTFEDIEWVKDYVDSIDENSINFKPSIEELPANKLGVIKRYVN
ncbi:DEAD/DEAH box helicase [Seleniivibrio woodruffii]|uniref:RAD3-like DEAD/DEAH box helicase n=1 Tax=Seleniivibrio woodruffii TaxID=1078050 RepID=A0A4R1K6P9_9BACT|nr:DEAD/DEAH box helicase [Seleniivibrio woodruffii]TCK59928.1 RAD3-like DEAD/DEAH box helicase [Seleniivibrio woodruffii]TVZ35851.1 RAD3-like DEAD/DEAH box helicase [Seleniivibrio woodruffii]